MQDVDGLTIQAVNMSFDSTTKALKATSSNYNSAVWFKGDLSKYTTVAVDGRMEQLRWYVGEGNTAPSTGGEKYAMYTHWDIPSSYKTSKIWCAQSVNFTIHDLWLE